MQNSISMRGGEYETMTTKTGPAGTTKSSLWKRVGELGASSAFLMYLAESASDRLSLTQAAFFMLAASAEAQGTPANLIQLREALGDAKVSIKNSYRQLLEPNCQRPKALGWLTAEVNPESRREYIIRLTETGRNVAEAALSALEPLKTRAH